MTSFKQFVKNKALEDKLPFDIDFEIEPESSEVAETIDKYEIPIFNELLGREAWFFELIESLNGESTTTLKFELRAFARKLKSACNLSSLVEAVEAVLDPPDDLARTPEYEDFLEQNEKQAEEIISLFKLSIDQRSLRWMRITFFMLSRVTGDWTMGKTVALRESVLNKIDNLIIKETNGGVEPKAIVETNAETNEGKGKQNAVAKKGKTGDKSTGK